MPLFSWRSASALVLGTILFAALATACEEAEEEGQTPTPAATEAPTATETPSRTVTPIASVPGDTATPVSPSKTVEAGNITLEFGTDKQAYDLGEPVAMRLTIRPNPLALLFYQSSNQYNFLVIGEEGRIVWSWAVHQTFVREPGEQVLMPGDEVTYHEVWDQRDNEGNQVRPGSYLVLGQSSHCDENLEHCGAVADLRIDIGGE